VGDPVLVRGWSVLDVVTHAFSFEEASASAVARRFVRGRFRLSGANAVALGERPRPTPAVLLAEIDRNLHPKGITRMFGSRVALLDALVHHQDIRRPLGRPRAIPAERLLPVLGFARVAPPLGAIRRIHGLRLVATDLDWTCGHGPEVRGPAESLLMVMAGRHDDYGDLDGPGRSTLLDRLRSSR
jgi:uncharacterized protein (TIGR03083 family)